MGNVKARGCVGTLLSICLALSSLAGCGEVTANGAEETQACAKKKCMGKDCPAPDAQKHDDAGVTCATSGGSGGAAGTAVSTTGAGGTGAAATTAVADFSCTVCRRAENCCKAEGLTDCGYTAACANATNAQQMQFYVVLCRAVLSASTDDQKAPADVCGF